MAKPITRAKHYGISAKRLEAKAMRQIGRIHQALEDIADIYENYDSAIEQQVDRMTDHMSELIATIEATTTYLNEPFDE